MKALVRRFQPEEGPRTSLLHDCENITGGSLRPLAATPLLGIIVPRILEDIQNLTYWAPASIEVLSRDLKK